MPILTRLREEKTLHLIFEITLIFKGFIAFTEIIGGILVFFISRDIIIKMVTAITQGELTEDPKDFIAHYLVQSAQHLSIGSQHFAALFLTSHGIIKLFLIIGLLREKLWYYPAAILVFGLFIIYQLYRFHFTHSLWLLLITVIDAFVIALTWHEWKYLLRKIQH
jgi:uncharacterized membrane protein